MSDPRPEPDETPDRRAPDADPARADGEPGPAGTREEGERYAAGASVPTGAGEGDHELDDRPVGHPDRRRAGIREPGTGQTTDLDDLPAGFGLDRGQVQVRTAPRPGGAGGAWRALGETMRGLKTSFGRIVEGPVTVQYPEEKVPVYPRFRGRHRLHRFEDSGLEKCVGCSLCAAACPADCIRVVSAENDPEDRASAGERYAAVYEINMSRCIFCGYCEMACPFDAITMGHDFELSDYSRADLVFTKEMLLAEPPERTPLRAEGE